MKLKLLLPVERLGLLVIQVDENQSFFQFVRPLLEQHNIDIHKHYLRDSYNNKLSVIKPMKDAGFYPGISVELMPLKTEEFQMNPGKNLMQMHKIKVKFIVHYLNKTIEIQIQRYSTILSVLLQNKLVDVNNTQDIYAVFNQQVYSINNTFDSIGALQDIEIDIIKKKYEDAQQIEIQNEEDNQKIQISQLTTQHVLENEELKPVTNNENEMTKDDYNQFQLDKLRWNMEMGNNQILTYEEQLELKKTRQQRKGQLVFKIVSTQLRLNLNIKISISAVTGTLQNIYQEFNILLIKKFHEQLNEDQLASMFLSYKLRNGRFGQDIFASEFEAYEYFNGADAVLDLEITEEEFQQYFKQL